MRLIVLLLAAALAGPAAADDIVFDANYRTARENAGTPTGAAYDLALGAALQAAGTFEPAIDACMAAHPDASGVLNGYFQFSTREQYQVVLRPKGPLASCIESALEGLAVPPPPSVPWFNVFVFNIGEG
jgi:hypothetical protein